MGGILVQTSGKVVTVTLDCPPVNALTVEHYRELTTIFDSLGRGDDPGSDVNCAILAARGEKAFCAGLDLNEFLTWPADQDHVRALAARELFRAVRQCAIPTIAAVNGAALGTGCVLSACCDIRIASDQARFGLPEINVGRCGGGAHVGRLVPPGLLRLMYFTGEPISAAEAHRSGFVERLVAPEALMDTAVALAGKIAAKSPLGLRMAKQALNGAEFLPVEEGYALEQTFSTRLLGTEDAREATRAVLEKRKPAFKGR